MIRYQYKKSQILFVGINPHFGSYDKGVPFSNNKMFWYLLSDAGIIREKRNELREDNSLRLFYKTKFNKFYKLGLVNIIDRPTRDVSEIHTGEELPGRKKICAIIREQKPKIVCFIGKITYEKYINSKDFTFGWQKKSIGETKFYVMHFPLRGAAVVRINELKEIVQAANYSVF
ncbi:MAG: hypothetical protein EVJ46_02500 [Candidatus Acididesulfobacter guangdongensis]|uniref:Uracil-DNA glycosylase-like domain-containing protein n=1 Tax=Acididesulfobacter guangdongensis TaxID=2597225 RepID=A0A519BIM8_ACIG2|nr:MAG: hypothetical protein EVJ46_02500 [Candidatus Acididesulfobacter guangdongensis]